MAETKKIYNEEKNELYEDSDKILLVTDEGVDYTGRSMVEIVKVDNELKINESLKPVMGYNVNVNKNV